MAKTTNIQGDLQLLGVAYMGKSDSPGTTRTIELRGSEANKSLSIVTSGTGTIQVPVGYEANIGSDRDLVNRAFVNTKLAGKNVFSLVTTPTVTEDGFAITWDNTNTRYTLTAVATALTFSNGLTKTGSNVKLGGTDILDASTDVKVNATGVLYLRASYTTGSDEAGVAIEAIAQDNNEVRLYSVGGSIRLTPTEAIVTAPGTGALKYAADYSGSFNSRSLTDVAWSTNHIGGKNVDANIISAGASEDSYVITWQNGSSTYKLMPTSGGGAGGTVTSVDGSGGSTGLTLSGGPFSTTGTLTLGGTLVVANGGTGATTFTAGRILIGNGASAITTDSTLTYDTTNDALSINSIRIHSPATSTNTTFVGVSSGNFTTTGNGNTGIGRQTLQNVTSGASNFAGGYLALRDLTTGTFNISIGNNSLVSNTTGSQNTAIGVLTLSANGYTATGNTAVGYNSGSNTTGSFNIFLGYRAGETAITGSNIVIIGSDIDPQSTSANGQLSIQNAIFGVSNTNTGTSVSTGNIGIYVASPTARLHIAAGDTTTGPLKLTSGTVVTTIAGGVQDGLIEYDGTHLSIVIGSTRYQLDQQGGGISGLTTNRIPYATSATTLADDSAFTWDATNDALTVGTARLFTVNLVSDSLFLGQNAGNFTTSGNGANTGLGNQSLNLVSTGEGNTAVGFNALQVVTTGSRNTSVGLAALALATGSDNIAIGASAGANVTTGSFGVFIGSQINAQSATANGQLSIQNIIFGTGNTATGTSVSTGSIGIGVATSLGGRLHVRGTNNAVALLVDDDAGNAIASFGESGGARVLGFYGATPVIKQTSGANLTNNVTSGGTDDTIADFTDLTIYANDSASIRNNIYQLSRKLKQCNDALRLYGLLT